MRWADVYPWAAPETGRPVIRQVYDQVRNAIHAGALKPGGRLPSSRDLAVRLGVARASVVAAYDQLLAEGYAEGRTGSGTYVSTDLSGVLDLPPPKPAPEPAAAGFGGADSVPAPAGGEPSDVGSLSADVASALRGASDPGPFSVSLTVHSPRAVPSLSARCGSSRPPSRAAPSRAAHQLPRIRRHPGRAVSGSFSIPLAARPTAITSPSCSRCGAVMAAPFWISMPETR